MKLLTIFFIGILFVFIMNSCNQYKILGDYANHFNKKELNLIRSFSDSSQITKEMVIGNIIINDSLEVGLYFYKIYKQPSSVVAIHKLLKFETKIVFPSGNEKKDKAILNDFLKLYSSLFTQEQLNNIIESFLVGTEITGRTL